MSLDDFARYPLTFGPSPIHPLPRLSAHLGGRVEIWVRGWRGHQAVDTAEPL